MAKFASAEKRLFAPISGRHAIPGLLPCRNADAILPSNMPLELLAHYRLAPERYDEIFESELAPRRHCQLLFEKLKTSSPESMRDRVQSVQRQLRENGVTYNIYADPQGSDRPWELDALPLIIPAEEWRDIETAVIQRAALLNRILVDVYGEQRLLREGLMPAALVYGHPAFLRPLGGVRTPGDIMLHTYAADLARSPDGRWWVVGDRTQAPSGAGYALENRLVVSRLFADLFRDLKVQRLAGFFATLRDSLAHWSPTDGGAPLTVLLTPGHLNETYFEHTYLARYLGFPLVEGSDLTVREGKVWLKTLSGLQRVTTILRRLDDDYCDPLELRGDSALGVPGLIGAIRNGTVLVANALGSNLLESGALLGFLPRLCRRLLDEPLKMPSVATWWCGEPTALDDVIARLDRLVIKGTYPQMRAEPIFGDGLSERGRKKVLAMLRARPGMFVAQELVQLSQAPVINPDHPRQLLPRVIGLRVYACATPNGYAVMPGGLTRAATGHDARVISMQRGGTSKDTWVLSTRPVSTFSLLRREISAQDLVRIGPDLSSRVAENLFWLGRLAERCDNSARLLRAALARLIDETAAERGDAWASIVELVRRAEIFKDGESIVEETGILAALRDAIENDARPGLASSLRQLLGVASQLRSRLSNDNWHTLNGLSRRLDQLKRRQFPLSDLLAELDRSISAFMTLSGFALDGMTRDHGWRFLSLGRRIERLQFLSLALGVALEGSRSMELDWLLELGDSAITYRSRYMARPEWLPVLDLLVRDASNPRSIVFQLKGLNDFLQRLDDAYGDLIEERFDSRIAALDAMDPDKTLQHGSSALAAFLEDCNSGSLRLSEQLGLSFFSHAGAVTRQTFAT
jgi:uncharacterized circularly permuted ATP-grasp superfamily protein/uncharacterized alpha-E superfamily protein